MQQPTVRVVILLVAVGLTVWHSRPTAEAQITLDGSLGPGGALAGPNFAIGHELGQIRGRNLFHSFGTFNVRTGESATFSGPADISNILGRVTGGSQSVIDGLLRSTISGANLFLLNPRGVVFGPNARLDVSGSFHVSTADAVRLADGGIFSANLASPTNLTIAPPAAFGFLGPAPASISIEGSVLQVPPGQTLSVLGGDVQVTGAVLRAPGGLVQVGSAASSGEMVPSAPGQRLDLAMNGFASQGRIDVTQFSNLTVSNAGGAGVVLIRGGRLTVDSASLNANTTGAGNSARPAIDVRLTGEFAITNGSQVVANSFAAGNAGDIQIVADSLRMSSGGFISSGAFGAGSGGTVTVDVRSLEVVDFGTVNANTFGPGQGGNLVVTADEVLLAGVPGGCCTGLFASQFSFGGTGNAGNLTLTAGSLRIVDGAQVAAGTFGIGRGGTLTTVADTIFMSGSSDPNVFTGIFANTFGAGSGGVLTVRSQSLEMTNRATIQAATFGTGDAGSITVETGRLDLSSGSSIFSTTIFGGGRGGLVDVTADTIRITGVRDSLDPFGVIDFTGLSTATGGFGLTGGNLRVNAGRLEVTDKGGISAVSFGAADAGSIQIQAGTVLLTGGGTIGSSAFGSGRGGAIDLTAQDVTVTGAGRFLGITNAGTSAIASQAASSGAAGDLRITVPGTLSVLDGGKIAVDTFGTGAGGGITITAGRILVSGTNLALAEAIRGIPGVESRAASASISATSSRLLAGDGATGRAGAIAIAAGELRVDADGSISTKTTTPGAGGNIDIVAGGVVLGAGGAIAADSAESPAAGRAGDISVTASGVLQMSGASVTTTADRAEGGAIRMAATTLQLANGSLISARSTGPGDAGSITLIAADAFQSTGSSVTTQAAQADGGNITIRAGTLVRLVDSSITSSVQGGEGRGGNITIDPTFVVLQNSQIRADAFGGPGGNVTIVADVFLSSGSVLSASSALGVPGTVDVQAATSDLSTQLVRLPESVVPAAELLRASCGTRFAGGRTSSLVIAARAGLPLEPGAFLPVPLLGDASVATGAESGDDAVVETAPEDRDFQVVTRWTGRSLLVAQRPVRCSD